MQSVSPSNQDTLTVCYTEGRFHPPRCSLLSSGDEGPPNSGRGIPEWSQHHRVGKFLWRRSCSASNLASTFQSVINTEDGNHMRSLSSTVLDGYQADPTFEREEGKSDGIVMAPVASSESLNECVVFNMKEEDSSKNGAKIEAAESKSDNSNSTISPPGGLNIEAPTTPTEPKSPLNPPAQHTPITVTVKKVSERISLLKNSTTAHPEKRSEPSLPITAAPRNSKWQEAYNKAKALKTVQESQSAEREGKGRADERGEGKEGEGSAVKQRALLFGAVTNKTRRPLRRTQSVCDANLYQARSSSLNKENPK